MMDAGRLLVAFEQLAVEIPVLLGEADLTMPVPSCPGWSVADLVAHLGRVHLWAEHSVRVGDPEGPAGVESPLDDRAELALWYRNASESLTATLRSTSPDAPCWAFGPRPHEAAFWYRRQAHEVAVHRWDLGSALGRDLGYPAELAVDGIDEVVGMFFPRQVRRHRIPPLTASLALAADGGPSWVLRGDGRDASPGPADASVAGPPDALVLLLWGRVGLDDPRLTVTGPPSAAAAVLGAGIVP